MTENEAKKLIAKFCEDRMNFARGKDMSDKELDDFCEFSDALNLSISSLEEIQQYQAIGTVEECREAMEKQKEKEPLSRTHCKDGNHTLSQDIGRCPSCNGIVSEDMLWCEECGQKLCWSDTP